MRKNILLLLSLILLSTSTAVQQITPQSLSQIQSSSKIWLVYGTTDLSDPNSQVLHDVSDILAGFFKVGILANNDNKLTLYGDDGSMVDYDGKFQTDAIIQFVLSNTNKVIAARSAAANAVKANKQFKEKQAARANKQWSDEQQLRKKSDTLLLDTKNWQSAFLKEREPVFINFYEANCSACVELNREWEAVATALKGKARVAKLNITEAEALESSIRLTSFPVIRYYPVGTKNLESFTEFDGVKKKFSILEWANSKLASKQSSISIPQLNKANYKTMCKESKSTCILLFVEDPATVTTKIGQLAAKHIKKPIAFLVSRKGAQAEFEKQAGVEGAPDTVMVYCKGKKIMTMGGMDFGTIEEVINEIALGNRNNFSKLAFQEKLV